MVSWILLTKIRPYYKFKEGHKTSHSFAVALTIYTDVHTNRQTKNRQRDRKTNWGGSVKLRP